MKQEKEQFVWRCDTCQNFCVSQPSLDEPYGDYRCGKGHWEGGPPIDRFQPDPWKHCVDFTND